MALTLLPLNEKTPEWAAKMTRSSLRHAIQYNNVEIRMEDEKALRHGRPYVVGESPSEHTAGFACSSNTSCCSPPSSSASSCVQMHLDYKVWQMYHLDIVTCSSSQA